MPGFRHCKWCHGKGCMCCDAEQKKCEAAESARPRPTAVGIVASLLGTTPEAIAKAKRHAERGSGTNPRHVPDIPGWAADRFRYCRKCDGKGCPKCLAERTRFIREAVKAAPEWRPGDIRDVRDAADRAEADRAARGLDALTEDEIEALFMPAMDAEYKRQFPDGPRPVMSAQGDSYGRVLVSTKDSLAIIS